MALADAADNAGEQYVVKKSVWSKEEDRVLRQQVLLHGAQNWCTISLAFPGRSSKSCRLRWCQHLAPDVEAVKAFTREEDEVIIRYQRVLPALPPCGGPVSEWGRIGPAAVAIQEDDERRLRRGGELAGATGNSGGAALTGKNPRGRRDPAGSSPDGADPAGSTSGPTGFGSRRASAAWEKLLRDVGTIPLLVDPVHEIFT